MPATRVRERHEAFLGFSPGKLRSTAVIFRPPTNPDLSSLSDESLIHGYCAGHKGSFEELYRRHRAPLYRFIIHITATRADADEVFQEVWLAVIRGAHGYAPTARFVTYLFAIAHRRTLDRTRSAWRWKNEPLEAQIDLTSDDNPLIAASNAELAQALTAAITALPFVQREAFLLQAEAGLSLEEIAEMTDVPRETVKSRLRYANRKLRESLAPWK